MPIPQTNNMNNNPRYEDVFMWVSEIPESKKQLSQQLQAEVDQWLAHPENEVTTYAPGLSSGILDVIESERLRNRRTRKLYEEEACEQK